MHVYIHFMKMQVSEIDFIWRPALLGTLMFDNGQMRFGKRGDHKQNIFLQTHT